jgi:hypothetical protein
MTRITATWNELQSRSREEMAPKLVAEKKDIEAKLSRLNATIGEASLREFSRQAPRAAQEDTRPNSDQVCCRFERVSGSLRGAAVRSPYSGRSTVGGADRSRARAAAGHRPPRKTIPEGWQAPSLPL